MKETIFVQIASYRDPELIPTLIDITKQADRPENLKIVVCWQHGEEQATEDFLDAGIEITEVLTYHHAEVDGTVTDFHVLRTELRGAVIDFIDVDYTLARGACWARHMIQQHYVDEIYTLQLDSHHRFVEGWDTILINMLNQCKKHSKKPVLTGYIPSYNPEKDPEGRVQVPWQTNFDRFIPESPVFFIPSEMKDWKEKKEPIRARFYSGHFAFADGSFAVDVQHDPEYFFHGEEISIAARAFTHGYDLYTPHKIVAWHEYTRKGRTKVWDDHTTDMKKTGVIEKDWVERNELCHKRNKILFGMDGENPNQIDFGKYGFGAERTVREYEEYAGISFEYRGVQQATLDQTEPPVNYPYETEEEWKNSFARSNDIRICVHKNEFPKCFEDGKLIDDIDFCYVGAHDSGEVEIQRKDLSSNEFKRHINSDNGWIDYRFIFVSTRIPKSYTLWPHSKSRGWLGKVKKDV